MDDLPEGKAGKEKKREVPERGLLDSLLESLLWRTSARSPGLDRVVRKITMPGMVQSKCHGLELKLNFTEKSTQKLRRRSYGSHGGETIRLACSYGIYHTQCICVPNVVGVLDWVSQLLLLLPPYFSRSTLVFI